jgi:hypothetical protein
MPKENASKHKRMNMRYNSHNYKRISMRLHAVTHASGHPSLSATLFSASLSATCILAFKLVIELYSV